MSAAIIRLTQATAADVATPPSGKVSIFLDSSTGNLSYKDSSGVVHVLSLDGATTPAYGDNDTSVATTAFVQTALYKKVADGNSGATFTVDWSAGNIHTITLTASCALTFTAPSPALGALTLMVTQDGTGSRTVTWPGTVKWPGGTAPSLTTTAGKMDVFNFVYDGTNYIGATMGTNY